MPLSRMETMENRVKQIAKAGHDPGRDHGGLIVAASKRKAAMNRQVRAVSTGMGNALGEGDRDAATPAPTGGP